LFAVVLRLLVVVVEEGAEEAPLEETLDWSSNELLPLSIGIVLDKHIINIMTFLEKQIATAIFTRILPSFYFLFDKY
jgi:hypothetical protein